MYTAFVEDGQLSPLDGVSVLCVDDEQDTRYWLGMYLSSLGALVFEAESGEQGLQLFQLQRPDIIIADIRMSGMDGITMCKAIRAIDAKVPIILLTAYSEAELMQQAICLGVVEYIVKPVSAENLSMLLINAVSIYRASKQQESTLNQLQATLDEYQQEEHRLYHYVTQIIGNDQHCAVRVLNQPKQMISGDFHCIEATQDCLYALLADGMGHGLSAILPALDLPRKFHALAGQQFSLARIADELNRLLYQQGLPEHFVVMTLVCFDISQQLIEVVNCGNPKLLLVDMEGKLLHEFPSNHLPFGIVAGDDFYPEIQTFHCAIPARLYLYSDGLAETLARNHANVEQLMAGLFVERYDPNLLDRVADLLRQIPSALHHDDVTLLELRFIPGEQGEQELRPATKSVNNEFDSGEDTDNLLKWLSVLYVGEGGDGMDDLPQYLMRRVGVLYSAGNALQGLQRFKKYRPQLVIADVMMPSVDGLEMVQQIRQLDPEVPVIMIGGMASWQARLPQIETLLDMEISKFLVKPLDGQKLMLTISQCVRKFEYLNSLKLSASVFMTSPLAITITDKNRDFVSVNPAFTAITGYTPAEVIGCNPRILSSGRHDADFYRHMWQELEQSDRWSGEIWNRRKNGELFIEWISISVIRDNEGNISNYASVFADITQRNAAEEKLRHLAHHDCLTNLPNRVLMQDRLQQAILQAQRENSQLALIYLDIDHFKNVNDTYGHGVGDELIVCVTQVLQSVVREADTVSRLGGDEFAILLPGVGPYHIAVRLVSKIFNAVCKTYLIAGRELRVTLSMGVSLFPRDGDNPATLLKHADSAMYLAKKEGRNNYQFFDKVLESQAERYTTIQHGLHNALKRGEFFIHYQPKYALDTKCIVGAEALLRWLSPELGMVSPAEFIPIAEETGFIVDMGCWLVEQVCKTIAGWRMAGVQLVPVAINISPIQFHRGNLQRTLLQAITNHRISSSLIQVELTEGVVMNRQQSTIQLLKAIKNLGIAISIDDFGTGYSSLSYLRTLPIDELKIDRSFIMEIIDETSLADSRLTAIPLAVIDLAKNLNLRLVAEGVETEIQGDFLLRNGCTVVQGYLFSRPVSQEAMQELLS